MRAADRTRARTAGALGTLAVAAWVACSSGPPAPSGNMGQATDAAADGGTVPACGACSTSADCAATLLCSSAGYCALQCPADASCPLDLPCLEGLCSCVLAEAGPLDAATEAGAIDAAAPVGDGAAGAPTAAGFVTVSSGSYFLGGMDAGASVGFTDVVAQFFAAGGPCLPSVVAGCQVFSCFGEPAPGPTAGTVTVSGGSAPAGGISIAVDPDAGTYGAYFSQQGDDFPEGSSITVAASGGAVPAFEATVTASTDVYMAPLPASVDRTSGTTLTWTPGAAPSPAVGSVVVSLSSRETRVTVVCSAAVSAGSLALPAAALQALPTGYEATLDVGVQNETKVMAGSFPVTVEHATIAHTASGDEQGTVTVVAEN